MYKGPEISNKECSEISKAMSIDVMNKKAWNGLRPAIKENGQYVDTSLSFDDKRYSDVIKELKGHVLITGLGFGCAVLGALKKKSVKSVTVVEIRKEVIDLFYSLHSVTDTGLTVVNMDAKDYKETGYDHVFIDHFHTPLDYDWYLGEMEDFKQRYKDSNIHYIKLK